MIRENKELMHQARLALDGNWETAVVNFLIYFLIVTTASSIPFAPLIIGGPFALGLSIFSLNLARKKETKTAMIFEGFSFFANALATYLLMALFITLWSLLLIVPGIIAAISYSQTFFIMTDDRSIEPMEALRKSKKMMYGYKWKFFCLGLRFTGWFLLCLLTLGVGFLWLAPYMKVSFANFYDDLKLNVSGK